MPVTNPGATHKKRQDWRTPRRVFAQLHSEYLFTTDAASDEDNALCAKRLADGLHQTWEGQRVWCNPPYSRPALWLNKAADEWYRNRAPSAILLPAAVDTKWFAAIPRCSVRVWLFSGRLKFWHPDESNKNSANFANMLVTFGLDHEIYPFISGMRSASTGEVVAKFK